MTTDSQTVRDGRTAPSADERGGGDPATREDVAVRLRGVAKSFAGHLGLGRTVALDGLDLDVVRGEILGLLGPNGAGKTTTLKLLLGLLRPDRGTIDLLGGRPGDRNARARIGFLTENPYFYDHLTAAEFLDFYARLQGIPAARRAETVRGALARVGLEGRGDVRMRKFSKGMLQRVGLAQAIQHDPELVILDEPMSGLDPIGRREVRDLILEQREAGRTVLFSSHILQDAELVCDRVAILDRGRLHAAGRLVDLVPGEAEWFEVTVRGDLPGTLPGEPLSRDGSQVLLRVADVGELGRLLAAVAGSGGQVSSVWPRRLTLEDLFLRRIREARSERGGR